MAWVAPAIGAAGSILGGMAGGKKSGGNQAPRWLRHGARDLGQMGQSLAQQPYQPYGGDRVAPFSPDTMNAFDMIRANVGTTQPYYSSALETSQRLQNGSINPQMVGTSFNPNNVQTQFDPRTATAAQWAGTDLSPYLNPYTNEVVDASLADLENQRAVQYNGLASQAQAAGAFGGSRFGVAQGQFEADALRNKSLLAAQLRNQGFETAAQLASQDVNSRNQFGLANQAAGQFADQLGMQGQLANQNAGLQAQQLGLNASLANQSADLQGQMATADMQNRNAFLTGILGDRMGAANMQDAESMARVGSAQDAQNQQQLDVNYSNYWDQTRAYPSQQLNWWSSALAPGTNVAGAGTPPQSGGLLGTLGGAQLGAQVGGSIYDWWNGMSKVPQNMIEQFSQYGNERVG